MNGEKALENFAAALKVRQLAPATREQYLGFARRYVDFARELKAASETVPTVEEAITAFLSSLTPCSVANQRGALAALAGGNGFYNCIGGKVGTLPEWLKATRPTRIPVWVTTAEAEAIMQHLPDPWRLMAMLMFGSGLRIGETIELRWRAFDFERGTVSIWSGKGDKCRIVALSQRVIAPLMERRERVRGLFEEDRKNGRPGVCPPEALAKKFPGCGKEWPFFWVFPSAKESRDPESGILRRHHIHDKSFAKPQRVAVRRSRIDKRVTAHAFRHGYATLYLMAGGNLNELQSRMGHESIETTQRYLHCLPNQFDRIGSPWDVAPVRREESPTILPFRKQA